MALAFVAAVGTAQEKVSDTSLAGTTTAAIEAGNLAVVVIAADNTGTADGDNSEVSAVSIGSLSLTKGREFTNGQGAAAAGATVSIWYGISPAGGLASGAAVTVTFASARAAKAAYVLEFTRDTSKTIEVVGSAANKADDGVDVSGITTSGLTNEEHLHIRGCACEGVAGTFTPTATWTESEADGIGTTGGSGNTNIWAVGEHKISTSTGETSDPSSNKGAGVDWASTVLVLREVSSGPPPVELAAVIGAQSSVSTGLRDGKPLAATVVATSTVAGDARAGKPLAATVGATSTVAASVGIGRQLSATIGAVSVVAAVLAFGQKLAAGITGQSSLATSLRDAKPLAASIGASSAATGALRVGKPLAAVIGGASTVAAALAAGGQRLAAALGGTSSVAAALRDAKPLAAVIEAVSGLSTFVNTSGGIRRFRMWMGFGE